MKKTYVKPVLVLEQFVMNQTIATSCGYNHSSNANFGKPGHASKSYCGWYIGGDIYFEKGMNICKRQVDPNTDVNGVCYDHPSGANTIFASW